MTDTRAGRPAPNLEDEVMSDLDPDDAADLVAESRAAAEADFEPWEVGYAIGATGGGFDRGDRLIRLELGRDLTALESRWLREGFDCGLRERACGESREVDWEGVPY